MRPERVDGAAVVAGRSWALLAVCAVTAAVALAAGPTGWRPAAAWDALAGTDAIAVLRAPRVVLAGLVGAALGLAGVGMQTLLANDLADPYILGVSGGASAGAVASLIWWPALPLGAAAAVGAGLAAAVVSSLARGVFDPTQLLLAGVTIGSLLGAVTGVCLVVAPHASSVRSALYWLFGGLGTPTGAALIGPAAIVAVALVWMRGRAARLDRLRLGSDVAATLGVDVARVRRATIALSVGLTAAAVSVAGLIGFVGLLAPHMARRLGASRHRDLVPVAAALGAVTVMVADAVARTAFAPRELPVGLLTAMVGGPVFLLLLRKADAP